MSHFTSDTLRWPYANAEQLDFMRRVYDRQVSRAAEARDFQRDVGADELAVIEGAFAAPKSAAAACRQLLAAARADLVTDPDAESRPVREFGLARGYQPASEQLRQWQQIFPVLYAETAARRSDLRGGPHGDAATASMSRYVAQRQEAPGFGSHNSGLGVDFRVVEGERDYDPRLSADSAEWRRTWSAGWLARNAKRFRFQQSPDTEEPWHWDYTTAAQEPRENVDPDRAVAENRNFSQSLGWSYDQVTSLLGVQYTPTEAEFARLVADWQAEHGLDVDGIVGPRTWSTMSPDVLTLSSAPAGSAPAVSSPDSEPLTPRDIDAIVSQAILDELDAFQHIPIDTSGTSVIVHAAYFINTERAQRLRADQLNRSADRDDGLSDFNTIVKSRNSTTSALTTPDGRSLGSGDAVYYGKAAPDDIKGFTGEALAQGVIDRYVSFNGLPPDQRLTELEGDSLRSVIQAWIVDAGIGVDCSGFVQQAAIAARDAVRAEAEGRGLVQPPATSHTERRARDFAKGARVGTPADLRPGDAWVLNNGTHVRIVATVETRPDGIVEFDTAESAGDSAHFRTGPLRSTHQSASAVTFGLDGSFHRIDE